MATTVSATVARPVRGGAQTGVGYAIVSLIAAFHSFTPEQFGALVGVATILVAFLHNLAEDRGVIPALLKAEPPADDPVPVVDTTVSDKGEVELGGILFLLLFAGLVIYLGVAVHPLLFLLLLIALVVLVV